MFRAGADPSILTGPYFTIFPFTGVTAAASLDNFGPIYIVKYTESKYCPSSEKGINLAEGNNEDTILLSRFSSGPSTRPILLIRPTGLSCKTATHPCVSFVASTILPIL